MELTFQFQPDAGEQVRASRIATKGTPAAIFWTVAPTVVAIVPLLLYFSIGPNAWRQIQWGVWTPVALFLLYAIAAPIVFRLRLRRTYRREPLLFSQQTLTVSSTGVALENAGARTVLNWQTIRAVREETEFYLFFYTRQCALYLPKRVIPDGDTDRRLREFVTSHAPDRGKGLARESSEGASTSVGTS